MSLARGEGSWYARLAAESGLSAILSSSRDTKLLCLQRLVRLYAYGATFLILAHFLSGLDIPDERIGLFMTLTLLGDTVVSLVLTTITDRIGRRRVLAAGAALMVLSGLVFAVSSNYWFLVAASVLGVISPSGNEIGPFRAVEESIIAQLTDNEKRSDIFAWYTLFGTAGAAVGTVTCGWTVQALQSRLEWTQSSAYRAVFTLYAGVGIVKCLLVLLLSPKVELQSTGTRYEEVGLELEDEGLLSEDEQENGRSTPTQSANSKPLPALEPALPQPRKSVLRQLRSLLPYISPLSRSILYRLLLLFTLDSFASGMATPSWMTYFFTTVHHLPISTLGTLFLVTNLLATISNLLALPIARRIGPLKTMVFTHLPSAIFLAAIPLPPTTPLGTWIAMAFLAFRACTQSMDQAPRQAFLAAAVLPSERTAVLGVVNMTKTLAQAGGVGASGVLAARGLWVAVLGGAGAMKATYDLLMLWMFLNLKSREKGRDDARDEEQR
jgi:MFS family permease